MSEDYLIQVRSAGTTPWTEVEELGQRKTWASQVPEDFRVIWCRKRDDYNLPPIWKLFALSRRWFVSPHRSLSWRKPDRVGENLSFEIFSHLLGKLGRQIANQIFETSVKQVESNTFELSAPNSLEFASLVQPLYCRTALEQSQFNFLVLTTSTTYINFETLREFLTSLPTQGVYGGKIWHHETWPFASGAYCVMSRDVVQSVVDMRKRLSYLPNDDVALGELIAKSGVATTYESELGMFKSNSPDIAEISSLGQLPVIRCTPGAKIIGASASIEIMTHLWSSR